MSDDYEELKKDLDAKWRSLGDFLEPENQTFDEDEQEALNPILKSLAQKGDHYTDHELVSQGGEKQIFKVRDLRTDRIVAMAKPRASSTNEEKEEFLREARLTARLQHPNIMTIHDQGIDEDGMPFFTMEFVQGEDLKETIERLSNPEFQHVSDPSRDRFLEIFIKVCDAVAYAHSRGVVHLDIKPANIKVGPFGEVHLCDWGLSRILTQGFNDTAEEADPYSDLPNSDLLNDLTASGTAKGTPGFMAHEQTDGQLNVSEQTDIYSLGAVLYYLLTGRPPISGETSSDIFKKTIQGDIQAFGKSPIVPAGLKAVTLKALSLSPADRYASVHELREELDRYLGGFPTHAQMAGPFERLQLLIRRRPARFFIAGIAFLVLTIALGIASVRINQSRQDALLARDQAEENLRLYTKESIRSQTLDDHMRQVTSDLQNPDNYLEAASKARLLRFQLEDGNLDTEQASAISYRLAMLHFVRQHFEPAKAYFEASKRNLDTSLFYEFASKFEHIPSTEQRWLDPQDVIALINRIPPEDDRIAYALAYYYLRAAKTKGMAQRNLPLVETLLDRLNHRGNLEVKLHTLHLETGTEGLHLSLSGKRYSVFHLPLPVVKQNSNVLNTLGLHSLTLSEGDIGDLIQLDGSGIQELKIEAVSDIPIQHLELLQDLGLKRLVHNLNIPDQDLQEILPEVELHRSE